MNQALAKLAAEGPTQAELERAKRRLLLELNDMLQLLNGPGGESGRAGILQRLNHYLGDPGRLPDIVAALERVSADDVKRVVRKYFAASDRVVVVTRPKPEGSAR